MKRWAGNMNEGGTYIELEGRDIGRLEGGTYIGLEGGTYIELEGRDIGRLEGGTYIGLEGGTYIGLEGSTYIGLEGSTYIGLEGQRIGGRYLHRIGGKGYRETASVRRKTIFEFNYSLGHGQLIINTCAMVFILKDVLINKNLKLKSLS